MSDSTDRSAPARTPESRPSSAPGATLAFAVVSAWCLGLLGLSLFSRFVRRPVVDDAYMFVRYADNWLAGHGIAWDPGGAPVFGLTSNLFLAAVVPLRIVFDASPGLAAKAAGSVCALVAFALLACLAWQGGRGSPGTRRAALLLFFFQALLAGEALVVHATSGMSTPFALAFLSVYLLLALAHDRSPGVASAIALGGVGALAYFARPDLLLYTCGVPAALFLLAPDPRARRLALLAGSLTAAGLGAELVLAQLYFGTALPLPFYAKSTGLYGPRLQEVYAGVAAAELRAYLWGERLLWGVIAVHLVLRLRGRGAPYTALHWGLLTATLAFIAYYRFGVLQIMGYEQRFYHPTLPALVLLAAHGVAGIAREIPGEWRAALRRRGALLAAGATAVALPFACTPIGPDWARDLLWAAKRDVVGADLCLTYCENRGGPWREYWPLLDGFSALPDDVAIASTETGMLGALNPRKRIVDLAGLHTPDFALAPFSADTLFGKHRPDLLYLPNRNYERMTRRIRESPRFAAEYHEFEKGDHWFRGFALRRASRHYDALLATAEGRRPADGGSCVCAAEGLGAGS